MNDQEITQLLIESTKTAFAFPSQLMNGGYGLREFPMERGRCFGGYIWRKMDIVACHYWINFPDADGLCRFPEHDHPVQETIHVFEGSMQLYFGDQRIKVLPGNPVVIKPKTKHWAEFTEICEYLTITQPPCKEFPYPEDFADAG